MEILIKEKSQLLISNTICVLVIYNTRLENSETFVSLSDNIQKNALNMDIVIYDNSPSAMYNDEAHDFWNIRYIHDPTNPGISKAYNIGARIAQELNKKWILFLDQDTYFPENTFNNYVESVLNYPQEILFVPILKSDNGIVSPSSYRFKRGFPVKSIEKGIQSLSKLSPLNSGIFIRIDEFVKCGGYNEKIKLDFSDFAFIERLRKLHLSFVVTDIICSHKLSTDNEVDIGLNKTLIRFGYYCEGARYSIETYTDAIVLTLVITARCLKLMLKFKSVKFIKSLLFIFLVGKNVNTDSIKSII